MTENEIATQIVDAAYKVHVTRGSALIKNGISRIVNGLEET